MPTIGVWFLGSWETILSITLNLCWVWTSSTNRRTISLFRSDMGSPPSNLSSYNHVDVPVSSCTVHSMSTAPHLRTKGLVLCSHTIRSSK